MSVVLDYIKQFPIRKTISVIILFVISMFAVKMMLFFFDKFTKRSKIEPLVSKILRVVIKILLLFTVFVIVLSSLGLSVSSLVATLSIVGVAFSLAIQGFLSNVFGGIQIISNKPFKSGDYVEAGGEAGTVREVGLFYTKLETPDKKLIQIPNSQIANDSIINYSTAVNRRVEFLVSVSYNDNSDKVRDVLLQMLKEHPLVLDEEGMKPVAHVKEFRDSDICYTARAWCKNKDYWTVYFDIMDSMKERLESNGVSFSYPHVNVHMINK